MTDDRIPPASESGATGPTAPETDPPDPGDIPLGQRLYDRPFLLLVVGLVIMLVFYTGWGIWEVVTLPEAPLP